MSNEDIWEARRDLVENPSGIQEELHNGTMSLDQLLFETIILDEQNGIKVKIPALSGDILRKLDLSKVDFSDVSWNILGLGTLSEEINVPSISNIIFTAESRKKILEIKQKMLEQQNGQSEFLIDYSITNAKIDLRVSFEAKYCHCINLSSCNFSNALDSCGDFNGIHGIYIINSNISGANLSIPDDICLMAINSNFKGINLSGRIIDSYGYMRGLLDSLTGCDLSDTGIKLRPSSFFNCPLNQKILANIMASSKLNGCYITDEIIKPSTDIERVLKLVRRH